MPCVRPLADIVDPCMPWESLRTRLWPLHGAASRSEVGVQWEKMNSNTAERSSLAGAAVWNAMEGCRPRSSLLPLTRCFPFITSVIELKAEDRSKFLDALVSLLS